MRIRRLQTAVVATAAGALLVTVAPAAQAVSPVRDSAPTIAELLKDCGTATDYCKFTPTGTSTFFTAPHQVALVYNCSSVAQNKTVSWSDSTGGSNTVSTEISVTAGFDFLSKFEMGFKQTYGQTWTWTDTFTNQDTLTVPAGEVGWITRETKMHSASGTYELHYGSPHWGHYIWYVNNFAGTAPVPQEAGVHMYGSRKMTPAEKGICGSGSGTFPGVPKGSPYIPGIPITHGGPIVKHGR
ncbi:hypothetical protein ACIPLC_11715 [Kitasatospora sp. NPDC086801]|uniref:hypothetical protein n=1 Tax=Kitasatospora sp. NPDC086801 TaxID=3364066 RepID=UPI003809C6CA